MPEDLDGHEALRRRLPWMALGDRRALVHAATPSPTPRRAASPTSSSPTSAGSAASPRCLRIAAIAEAAGIAVIPHAGMNTPYGQHFGLAMPGSPWGEYFLGTRARACRSPRRVVFPGMAVPKDGRLVPSTRPASGSARRLDDIARDAGLSRPHVSRYLARRIGMAALVVFVAVSVNFAIPRLMPGDAVEQQLAPALGRRRAGRRRRSDGRAAYRERFGLDQPMLAAIPLLSRARGAARSRRLDRALPRARHRRRARRPAVDDRPARHRDADQLRARHLARRRCSPGRARRAALKFALLPLRRPLGGAVFHARHRAARVFGLAWPVLPVGGGFPFGHVPRLRLARRRG